MHVEAISLFKLEAVGNPLHQLIQESELSQSVSRRHVTVAHGGDVSSVPCVLKVNISGLSTSELN